MLYKYKNLCGLAGPLHMAVLSCISHVGVINLRLFGMYGRGVCAIYGGHYKGGHSKSSCQGSRRAR